MLEPVIWRGAVNRTRAIGLRICCIAAVVERELSVPRAHREDHRFGEISPLSWVLPQSMCFTVVEGTAILC